MRTRREVAREEMTRDPIFLFQRGTFMVYDVPYGYEYDGDYFFKSDPDDGEPDESEKFTEEYLEQHDHGFWFWETELVFLTREEAEDYGRRRDYNYRRWRVYCIPAEGELAALLKKFDIEGIAQDAHL